MSDHVSVTIGIPFLNARRSLAAAVRSVFAQTHPDWELLLVDDGSSDGSLDVVRCLDDPRVRLVRDGSHRGLCARLNQIAAMARGAYLARMDADDVMHPERIERQLALLGADPGVDLVDTATFTVDDDLTPLGVRGDRPLDCRPEAVLRDGEVRAAERAAVLLPGRSRRQPGELPAHRADRARHPATLRAAAGRDAAHPAPGDAVTTQVDGLPHRHESRAARPADQEAKPPAQRGGDTGRASHSFRDPKHAGCWP